MLSSMKDFLLELVERPNFETKGRVCRSVQPGEILKHMMIPILDTSALNAAALMGKDVRLTHISLVAFELRTYKMNSPLCGTW